MTSRDWRQKLGLQPHPEGGWYREVYRSGEQLQQDELPRRFKGARAFSTAIYYLLEQGQFSAFHRIQQDELWHHYDGDEMVIPVIFPDGGVETFRLGCSADAAPMHVVPAACWFAAHTEGPLGFALVGCTVAPGFDFADFEMARREELLNEFPQHRQLVERFCPSRTSNCLNAS